MRKKKKDEHVNHERWLVSYADFITLLFAFFTTLYAISTVDAQKMGKMVMSMRASFYDNSVFSPGSNALSLDQGQGGAGNAPVSSEIVERIKLPPNIQVRDFTLQKINELNPSLMDKKDLLNGEGDLGRLKRSIETLVGADALKGRVRTHIEARGLIISLGEGGFFDSGSDQIKPEGLALLDTIATSFMSLGNHIRIEGHTDDVPIKNSKFPSNWELSTARATTIVSYLITKFGLNPEVISAAGYAEYRPVASNDSLEGRSRNRRVDIVVLNPSAAQVEP